MAESAPNLVEVEGKRFELTNLDKLLWPEDGYRKADLIKYYFEMAATMLPYTVRRPLSLHRAPDGIHGEIFYQKDAPSYRPHWLPVYPYQFETNERVTNLVIADDLASLAWIANQASVEIHTWLSRTDSIDRPDWAVFDLDPAAPATFEDARDIAFLIRTALQQFDLRGYLKTSGGKGLHIYVPLQRKYLYHEVRAFTEFIGRAIGRAYPEKITWEWSVNKRAGKVRIDYTQNVLGKTMVSAYSLRPLPGAPASAPITWEELEAGINTADFNIETLPRRVKEVGDLFAPALKDRQNIDHVLSIAGIDPPTRVPAPEEGDMLAEYRAKRHFTVTPEPGGEGAQGAASEAAAQAPAPGQAPATGQASASEQAPGEAQPGVDGHRFVVQEHHATRLHWDFRLEINGVLRSWAVPKGPPVEGGVRRLAVQTEDHPLGYIDFAGTIPEGEYGAGEVSLWDRGTYEIEKDKPNEMIFRLTGEKMNGRFVMIRTSGKNWLFFRGKE